jgi:predicted peroxiredoxin
MLLPTGLKALAVCSLGAFLITTGHAAASCEQDISKVEYAIDHAKRTGIDITVAERMRALLEDAHKERKAGNEQKCQELIDQAKSMGNVE